MWLAKLKFREQEHTLFSHCSRHQFESLMNGKSLLFCLFVGENRIYSSSLQERSSPIKTPWKSWLQINRKMFLICTRMSFLLEPHDLEEFQQTKESQEYRFGPSSRNIISISWIPNNRKVLLCLSGDTDHHNNNKIVTCVDPYNYTVIKVRRMILVKRAKQIYPGITNQAYCIIFERERSPQRKTWTRLKYISTIKDGKNHKSDASEIGDIGNNNERDRDDMMLQSMSNDVCTINIAHISFRCFYTTMNSIERTSVKSRTIK